MSTQTPSTSQTPELRPYILKALYSWISECGNTPHLMVDATYPGVNVPQEYVRDGRIVLNIAMIATTQLVIGDEAISFGARFNGRDRKLYIPMAAATALYAKETGIGMALPEMLNKPESSPAASPPVTEERTVGKAVITDEKVGLGTVPPLDASSSSTETPRRKGHLQLVK